MDELVGSSVAAAEIAQSSEGQSASGSNYKEIIVSQEGGALTITLNRPKKYNALNYQVNSSAQPLAQHRNF